MQLTVLVDNNTLIDRYLVGEPGVSYLIEHDGQKSFSIPDIRMFFAECANVAN
ncbi:hypothetical protein LNP17_26920 [Klebsiella variicola subsp. variicola]|nr:hypothetical protein [Klebsiella variicola subsp. variicola]